MADLDARRGSVAASDLLSLSGRSDRTAAPPGPADPDSEESKTPGPAAAASSSAERTRLVSWVSGAPPNDRRGSALALTDEGAATTDGAPSIGGSSRMSDLEDSLSRVISVANSVNRVAGNAVQRQRMTAQNREQRALQEAFEQFDVDNSNTIDVDELGKLMAFLGYSMSQQDLTNLVEQVATNGRTELTFAETEQLTQMYRSAAQFKLVSLPLRDDDESVALSQNDTSKASAFDKWLSTHISMRPSDDPKLGVWEAGMIVIATFFYVSALNHAILPDDSLISWLDAVIAFHILFFPMLVLDVMVRQQIVAASGAIHRAFTALDVFVALPFDIVAYAVIRGCGCNVMTLRVLGCLKAFKMLSTVRYFKSSGIAQVNRRYIQLYAYVFPVVRVISSLVCVTHSLALFWYWVAMDHGDDHGNYVEALYFTSYTITAVGYGTHDSRSSDARRLIAAVYCLIAQAIIAYVVGGVVSVLGESDVQGEGDHQVLQMLRVCQIAGVGDSLTNDATNFQDHLVRNKLADAYAGLVSNLPSELRDNITLFVKVRLVSSDSVFQLAHRATQVALAQLLESSIYRPGEALYLAGDTVEDMMFVAHGVVQVVDTGGESIAVFRAGAHLNEAAVIFGFETKLDTARAMTHCEIHVLSKPAFMSVRERFPVFDIEMNRISAFIEEKLNEQMMAQMLDDEHAMATAATNAPDVAIVDVEEPSVSQGSSKASPGGHSQGLGDVAVHSHDVLDAGEDDEDDAVDGQSRSRRQVVNVAGTTVEPQDRRRSQDRSAAASLNTPTPPKVRRVSTASVPTDPAASQTDPKAKSVDFTFTTAAGAKVDLNRISATFRAATGNGAGAMSFRNASMRRARFTNKNMNRKERFEAIAQDSVFGRLEAGDDDADAESAISAGGGDAPLESQETFETGGRGSDEDLVRQCEVEMGRIDTLLDRLASVASPTSRASNSMLMVDRVHRTGSGQHSPANVLSPRNASGSASMQELTPGAAPLVDSSGASPALTGRAAELDPLEPVEREEGEESGAPS